jgi:hypothetical protein
MNKKKCCMCQEELAVSLFKKNSRRPDGLQSQCIDCQRAYRKAHYEKNKQKYIDKATDWRKAFREWWEEYRSQFSCQECGENHPACLDFHHEDDNKEANISAMSFSGNKEKLLKELEKCICLCSNCHRKLHWKMRRE